MRASCPAGTLNPHLAHRPGDPFRWHPGRWGASLQRRPQQRSSAREACDHRCRGDQERA